MVGNYQAANIIVRNSPSGIITGIQNANGDYATDDELLTLNATEGCQVVIVLVWPTFLLWVEAIPIVPDILPGYDPR